MNRMLNLNGLGVNLVTPFNRSGEIDFPALERLVQHMCSSRVNFMVINGSASEAALLSLEEQNRVLDFVSEINGKTKPLIGGIPGGATRASVQRISGFNRRDLEAIYCDEPAPLASSPSGFIGHYRSVAQASPLPIIIEHKSGILGPHTVEALLTLAHEPNIVGVVESTGDVALHGALIRKKPKNFFVLSGRDVMALPLMALGAEGIISTIANAFPSECSKMMDQMEFGNFQDARIMHHALAPLLRILETEGVPTGIKAMLNHFQRMEHLVRLPNTPVSDEMKAALYRELAELPQPMVEGILSPV